MDAIRVGVIGLRFGRNIARALFNIPDADLVAVADRHFDGPESMETFAGRLGVKAYGDGEEMMASETLDAVCICTSPSTREPLVAQAARQGIAMFVEKPWATNLEHAQRLRGICEELDARVMLGFSFRFMPALARLRDLMDGELGAGWMLNGEYVFGWHVPAGNWLWDPRNGGGMINENSCHLFDAVCHLMGRPVSVMADAGVFMGNPSEDAAAVLLHFQGGGIAALTVGGIASDAGVDFPRINVITENGQAHLQGRHHIWERLSWSTRDSPVTHTLVTVPETLGRLRYEPALRHFCECVRSGDPFAASLEDGMMTVAVAQAVYDAARTGERVVLNW